MSNVSTKELKLIVNKMIEQSSYRIYEKKKTFKSQHIEIFQLLEGKYSCNQIRRMIYRLDEQVTQYYQKTLKITGLKDLMNQIQKLAIHYTTLEENITNEKSFQPILWTPTDLYILQQCMMTNIRKYPCVYDMINDRRFYSDDLVKRITKHYRLNEIRCKIYYLYNKFVLLKNKKERSKVDKTIIFTKNDAFLFDSLFMIYSYDDSLHLNDNNNFLMDKYINNNLNKRKNEYLSSSNVCQSMKNDLIQENNINSFEIFKDFIFPQKNKKLYSKKNIQNYVHSPEDASSFFDNENNHCNTIKFRNSDMYDSYEKKTIERWFRLLTKLIESNHLHKDSYRNANDLFLSKMEDKMKVYKENQITENEKEERSLKRTKIKSPVETHDVKFINNNSFMHTTDSIERKLTYLKKVNISNVLYVRKLLPELQSVIRKNDNLEQKIKELQTLLGR